MGFQANQTKAAIPRKKKPNGLGRRWPSAAEGSNRERQRRYRGYQPPAIACSLPPPIPRVNGCYYQTARPLGASPAIGANRARMGQSLFFTLLIGAGIFAAVRHGSSTFALRSPADRRTRYSVTSSALFHAVGDFGKTRASALLVELAAPCAAEDGSAAPPPQGITLRSFGRERGPPDS
jgi:hypothetical protein